MIFWAIFRMLWIVGVPVLIIGAIMLILYWLYSMSKSSGQGAEVSNVKVTCSMCGSLCQQGDRYCDKCGTTLS